MKYKSGLSSDDNPSLINDDLSESKNQLFRYMKMLHRKAEQNGKKQKVYQVFLAPHAMMRTLQTDLTRRSHEYPDILGFLSWESIHDVLRRLSLEILDTGHRMIVTDLLQLLERKDLYHYQGIELPEYLLQLDFSPYIYESKAEMLKTTYDWPTHSIEKEHYYVYNR